VRAGCPQEACSNDPESTLTNQNSHLIRFVHTATRYASAVVQPIVQVFCSPDSTRISSI
jgi:hypothetical protein